MQSKNVRPLLILFFIISGIVFFIVKVHTSRIDKEIVREVIPQREEIKSIVSTTAIVLPKNRLEIKPPVNGRIESVLVKEGEKVNSGKTIALMSSTERAALLDAARGKGEKELQYWQEAYKPIPLLSPIDGDVIVATIQPGQTVTTADPVIVLSDQLIVRARVDETDIGKIKLGQEGYATLDAYSDTKIKVIVQHIYYESRTINNVTMYEVDLRPEIIPEFFRSGMNANVNFVVDSKRDALVIPADAVFSEDGESFVLVKDKSSSGYQKCNVKLGIQEDKKIEVTSGLHIEDTIIIKTKKYVLPRAEVGGTNPFIPQRRQERR